MAHRAILNLTCRALAHRERSLLDQEKDQEKDMQEAVWDRAELQGRGQQ